MATTEALRRFHISLKLTLDVLVKMLKTAIRTDLIARDKSRLFCLLDFPRIRTISSQKILSDDASKYSS